MALLVAALVVALAVGAVGGWLARGDNPGTTNTAPPNPTTTATPAPVPPVALGPAVLVAGTARCVTMSGTVTYDSDQVSHGRNGTDTCTMTSNDPRVAGQYAATWNSDRWGSPVAGLGLTQWGNVRIENAGGAWEGRYTGAMTSKTGDALLYWFTGTGGYTGLSYCMWVFERPLSTDTQTGTTTVLNHGLIFPGTPPTP